MINMNLTQNQFQNMKADYPVYGTHTAKDRYNEEYLEKDTDPKCIMHVMWHPMTDAVSAQEYGRDISSMYYCILYDDNTGIDYNDVVVLFDDEYEVVGIKHFNTHDRIDIKKKAA